MKLGFIGAGKMATAIAKGLLSENVFQADDLMAADIAEGARLAFHEQTGLACMEQAADIVGQADAILLAVKPQVAPAAVAAIAESCRGRLIISIAAGIPIAKLASWFGNRRIVRVMPNTPAMVGKGAAVFTCGPDVTEADRELTRKIFGAVGIAMEMSEDKLDAVTALSGSGPAYIFEMIQTLVDGAVELGLSPADALALTTQTVAGAAEMVARKMGTPDELRVAVTSPGGTTAAGLQVMADQGFRQTMAAVVKAACDRSAELGRS
jgi:pyrroline-5-carboxylate reductase